MLKEWRKNSLEVKLLRAKAKLAAANNTIEKHNLYSPSIVNITINEPQNIAELEHRIKRLATRINL